MARLEDANTWGTRWTMLGRIAAASGVVLKLHAEKKPNFARQVAPLRLSE
jgi:hypothetical protein